ncbi:MAG: flippase-like domain-containing protein [Candidatus Pacearchaeota archaeon]
MKTSLRVTLGIIMLGVVVYLLRGIDFLEVYSLLLQANNFYLFLAFLSFGFSIIFFNLRSVYSISSVAKTGFWFNLKCTLGGNFINVITPGAQIGGEPVRAYYLGKRYKKSVTKLFAAIIADRVFHVTAILFFILVSVLYMLTVIPISPEIKVVFQTAIFSIFFIFLLVLLINSDKTRNWVIKVIKKRGWVNSKKGGKFGKIKEVITKHSKEFLKIFLKTLKTKRIVIVGITLSLINWILVCLSPYFLFISFGIHVNFLIVMAIASLGSAVGDLSPTPGGLGLVEGSMIFMYSALGINFAAAFAVSILSRIILYFFHLVLGGLSIIHLERNVG